MNREQKAAVVDEVAAAIKDAQAIFAVDYRGISVEQAAELRGRLREAEATLRIVKNTLTKRAVEKAKAEGLGDVLEGPTAFTFVREDGDAALAAKAIATFRRESGLLQFKGGSMEGDPLSAEEIESISRLPARDALQGQFVGVLASPLTGLVRGLGSLIQGLAIQLEQVRDQGLVGGEATAPEAASAEDEPGEPETASEAPGDPVAEAEAADQEQAESEPPSEGDEEAKEG